MSSGTTQTTAPNAQRLLWAGFMAILAAGVGYSVRGGILGQWANQFGFTMTELGNDYGRWPDGFWHCHHSEFADCRQSWLWQTDDSRLSAAPGLRRITLWVLRWHSHPAAKLQHSRVCSGECLFSLSVTDCAKPLSIH